MTKYPGGGWPEKVDKMIEKICTERKTSKPAYLQVEGADLEIIKLALKTGRMPCTTYSISPTGRYGGQKIAHMVNTVHMDETWAAVLDNNYPGDDAYEWMDLAAYRRAYASGSTGWTVILLANPPPPPPKN
jgi:ketol-acid reductoisomerase